MLPIGGKPLLEHTLEWLAEAGVNDVVVNLYHCPQAIPAYIGDGSRLGLSVHYSLEDRLLGTAGAAKRMQAFLDEPFVVVYGDVLTNLDLRRLINFHTLRRNQCPDNTALTLALYQVGNPTECGLVDLDASGRILRFVEKPPLDQVFTNLAFSGVLVCEPTIFDYLPPDTEFDFGHDLIPRLLAAGASLWGSEIDATEHVIDIGTLNGYFRALKTWASRNVGVRIQ
jgi:NDP-sugar pyrophosphorylase family protein